MSTIAHAVTMTTEQNGWPREVALMTLGWIAQAGGDYKQSAYPEMAEEFKALIERVAVDFAAVVKETRRANEDEYVRTPLAVEKNDVEHFIISLIASLGLHPAVAMQVLGTIAYAGGDLKKHIHIATLSAHMGKIGARHGYQVELTKAEDEPINITGAM